MYSWNYEYNLRAYMRNHLLPIPQPKMKMRVRVIGVLYSIYNIYYNMYIGFVGYSSLRLSGESIRSVRIRSLQRFARNLHVSRNKQLMLYLNKIKNAQIQQQSGMLVCVCGCVYKLRPKIQ